MAKFIRKLLLLLCVVLGLLCLMVSFDWCVVGSQYKYNYQAALLDKVQRLESIDEPKIILVGNSNLAFGMDSQKLEAAFNMPVVNLGLHGGLGNAFHEEIAKFNINQGDIIVVVHTSFSDRNMISDPDLGWITIDHNPKLLQILKPEDYWTMLKRYPRSAAFSAFLWLTGTGNVDEGGCYSRNAFNEYGDVVFKPDEEKLDTDAIFSRYSSGGSRN